MWCKGGRWSIIYVVMLVGVGSSQAEGQAARCWYLDAEDGFQSIFNVKLMFYMLGVS
jgi:hypothetical protein